MRPTLPVRHASGAKRTTLAAAGLLLGALLQNACAIAKPLALPDPPIAITVEATPITAFRPHSDQTRFGTLNFRGGLRLTSSFPGLGGISGFWLNPARTSDGEEFLAVTDAGVMLKGRLNSDGDRPIGLTDVSAAALLDDRGGVLALRKQADAEALAVSPSQVIVAIENGDDLWIYPRADPLGKPGKPQRLPREIAALRPNKGLESLLYVPSGPLMGALIGIGEQGVREEDDLPGFIIGGPTPGRFALRRSGVFSATSADVGPDGNLYLLERHFAFTTGVSMQVRRFRLADVKPGAVLDGEVLMSADMGFDIDNMEGLAVTVNAAGETLLTVVSDDNFSPIQRTLLLRFAVAGP
ncbi:MAG: hypothetical protein B7Z15_08060 [Rhizobiales bacterium 32-66-8]|nr:MAG: hypothetical protein B7Z15_08060 [Rhizobiales bacterium 32-66-8]